MTLNGRNMNAILPVLPAVRDLAWLVFLALALLAMPGRVSAADKPSKPVRVSISRLGAADDLGVEIHVRRDLGKVEALKGLSVHVAGGAAHLFGPVPSAQLKKQAIQIASAVPGVLEVRAEELYVSKAPPAVKPLVLPLEGERPTQTQSASPNSLSGVVESLTSRDPLPPQPQKPNTMPRTLPPWSEDPPPPSSTPQRVTLMAPEAATAPPRTAEPAVLTAIPRTPSASPAITSAVDHLRQGDRRFRSIRTEISGATVRVFSGDTPGAHVMAFVQAIRRLPGVQHVILKDTSLRPN